ncbi:MAG: GGDEF domain-containing protein [Clostridia bacterium]|nr:GGDEF domain-containing protein [Clostridia bacterium]
MSRQSTSSKGKLSFLALLVISITISASLNLLMYMRISLYISNNSIELTNLLSFFIFITALLSTIVFVLAGKLLDRFASERSNVNELKNFKNFVEDLHKASNEVEMYGILYNFVKQIPDVACTSLFYRIDRSPDDVVWQKLTDEKVQKIPLCNLIASNCPLVRLGRECYVQSIAKDVNCAYQLPEYKNGSYICLGITDGPTVYGVVQMYSKKDNFFDTGIISKVKSYIEIAKPVIQSKRTLHILDKQATTDKLTKLYNRTFIDPYLEKEIEAAHISGGELSVIMVDIDHFKKVNDTYGHPAGDHVLVFFSRLLMKCIRKSDLVSRYGGEEFIVVLPSTDLETAETIAERIRQTVASMPVPPLEDLQIHSITCSLGVATYPVHSDNKESLVKAADIALYKAKASGRNRVIIYSRDLEKDVLNHKNR